MDGMEVESLGQTSEQMTDLHIHEFPGKDTPLEVQRVEFVPVQPVVVMVRPVLQRHEQFEPRLPHCPVPHDVPPGIWLQRPPPTLELGWDMWDSESHGRTICGPPSTCERRELHGKGKAWRCWWDRRIRR